MAPTKGAAKAKVVIQEFSDFQCPFCQRHTLETQPALDEAYVDTGEVMWDISSPVYVKGKHWGGFRVGLSLDVIEREKNSLMHSLMIVMGVVLVISVVVTHIAVNFALAPLKKLTAVAQDLADAKNLERPIPVTRKDEVGRLQAVLERLRLSMIIALKKRKA